MYLCSSGPCSEEHAFVMFAAGIAIAFKFLGDTVRTLLRCSLKHD